MLDCEHSSYVVGIALRGKGAMTDKMGKALTSLSPRTEDRRVPEEVTAWKLSCRWQQGKQLGPGNAAVPARQPIPLTVGTFGAFPSLLSSPPLGSTALQQPSGLLGMMGLLLEQRFPEQNQ